MRNAILFLLCLLPWLASGQNYTVHLQSGKFIPDVTQLNEVKYSAGELVNGRYYRFIQFKSIPGEERKKEIEAKGISLYNYVPNNTYMAAIPATLDMNSIDDGNIRTAFAIEGKHKLDAVLASKKYPEWAMRGKDRIELVVMQHPDITPAKVAEWLKQEGAEVSHTTRTSHRIIINISQIEQIAALPYIFYLEAYDDKPQPDNLPGRTNHRSNMLATDNPIGLKYDGTGITVALNDDGDVGPHIDYQGRIPAQFPGFFGGTHGDHCAGTIFGAGNLNPTTRGMASGARLFVYGVGFTATDYQAFDSIDSHYNKYGVRITSTSYSNGANAGYTWLANLMDVQINDMPELMHVFSAGNAGTADYGYGAGAGWGNITGGHKQAKNVIATGNLSFVDVLANSSSRGPAHDGRIKPDICAVGTDVNSTIENNMYDVYSGTSMACPGIAGTLAQLYHAYKSMNSGNNPPSALMKALLLNTADEIGNPGPDYKHGWGRVNARRAYTVLQTGQYLVDSVSQSANKTHGINVPAGVSELRVMVYWHDYEATPSASKALVNDLNIKVTTPSSAQVLPWILNPAPNATTLNQNATQGVDDLNNVEQVTIPIPTAGTYTVSVNGYSVPQGPQKYYVVYEFVTNDIIVTYPNGGESFVPGVQETIRWDAGASTGTGFLVQYSVNNGANWLNIGSVGSSARSINWTPPSTVTGQALIKVTRGAQSGQSNNFSIIGVSPNLTVDWVCIDSMQVSYDPVNGATGYIISLLGNKYMDLVAFSTTTSCVVKNINTLNGGWFSVQAVAANNCKGRRAIAKEYPAALYNCTAPDDIYIASSQSPDATTIMNCWGSPQTEKVSVHIRNNCFNYLNNITVKYTVNGGTPVVQAFPGSLAPVTTSQFVFTQPVSFSATGVYTIKVWIEQANDQNAANDTITWQVNVVAPQVAGLPFSEDFETFSLCDTTANCNEQSCALAGDWLNEINNVEDQIDWRINSGPTPSAIETGLTGPMQDFKPGTATGKYAYLEASDCYNHQANLLTPCIDLAGVTNAKLSFAYHMFGAGMGELHVDVFSDGQWFDDVIPHIQGDQGNSWKTAAVWLPQFAGKVINVRFRGITGNTNESDMAIDDISLTDATGIREPNAGFTADIYPNPSEGIFNVKILGVKSAVKLSVADVSGKLIQQHAVVPRSGYLDTKLKLDNAPAGVYFLTIQSEQGTVNRKLVKF